MLKTYYRLTKPGIVYSNVMMAAAGFLLGSPHSIQPGLLVATLLGIGLVIASACVLNNYIDRSIDKNMERTKKRALASGTISVLSALIYSAVLGIAGFVILGIGTNLTTLILGIIAYFDYIVLYGWFKRRSVHGTLVGTISGSIPPAAGYTAVTGHFNDTALLVFLIMVFWQMPHFYAIAMYRFKDYKAAGLPVWPVKRGIESTKRQILGYIIAFTAACVCLTIFGITGRIFAAISIILGILWFWRGTKGFGSLNSMVWAKRMFLVSLIVLLVFSVNLSVGARLP